VGLGFPGGRWIYKVKKEFHNGVFISVGGSIDVISVISESAAMFMDGAWMFLQIITKPWRIVRLLQTIFIFVQEWIKGFSAR
jgi:UDP-N-acetyl-D-mannosaminuronic acid transferase (WecB/TagA/CpsF family)